MSKRSIHDGDDYDHVARTGVSLVIAVMVISSLPLLFGMLVWLPDWLERSGLAMAQVASF